MKHLKYFFQFLFVVISFIIFKILGPNISSKLGGKLFEKIGPIFKSKEVIHSNIKRVFPEINLADLNKIENSMWNNYGRCLQSMYLLKIKIWKSCVNIDVEGKEILDEIKLTTSCLYLVF